MACWKSWAASCSVLSPAQIEHIVRSLTAHELAQDRHDFIARHLLHTASHLTTATTLFGAVYLLSHGVSKLVLVVLVLQGRLSGVTRLA